MKILPLFNGFLLFCSSCSVDALPTGTRTTGHDASEERRPLWLGLLVGAPALLGVALQRRRKRSIP